MSSWTSIYKSKDLVKAKVTEARLHAAGIQTQFIDKMDSAFLQMSLGYYEILVDAQDEGEAAKVIDAMAEEE